MSIPIRIEVQTDDGSVEHNFTKATLVLGSDASADLVLDHESVDARHAVLNVEPGAVTIVDQGSKNGTFVQGASIDEARVFPENKVRLGRVTMQVFFDPNAAPAEGPKKGFFARLFGK